MSINFKIKKGDMFFLLSYVIFIVISILQMSFYYKYFMGAPYYAVILFCLFLLFLGEIIKTKISLKTIFAFIIICVTMLIILNSNNGMNPIIFVLIYLFTSRNISREKIIISSLVTSYVMLTFVIISSLIGIIPNYVLNLTAFGKVRYFLGFRYALYAPAILFNIIALEIYRLKDKISWSKLFFLFVLNCVLYHYSQSRLTFGLSVVMIISACVMKKRKNAIKSRPNVRNLMTLSYIICFIISIVVTINYTSSNSFMVKLDEVLGGRLMMGKLSLTKYGVNWFGQRMELIGNGLDVYGNKNVGSYFYIDNFYIQILQRFGIIFTIVMLIVLLIAMKNCNRQEDMYLLVILSVIAVHGIIDDLIIHLSFNSFWLLLGKLVIEDIKIRSSTKKYE